MWTLAVDATAAHVMVAFEQQGVPCILLKGRSFDGWLYAPGTRRYVDVDLLVPREQLAEAEVVLERQGFEHLPLDAVPGDWPRHSREWVRRTDTMAVDLHHTLWGVGRPERTWEVLEAQTELLDLGRAVRVLNEAARTLHVVLHAAQSGPGQVKPMDDLARALRVVSEQTWLRAVEIAVRVDALDAFVAGLSMIPEGRALAARLELPAMTSVEAGLRAGGSAPQARALLWFKELPSWRARMSWLLHKAFPPAAYMRASSHLAARGRLGLLAAYALRPIRLVVRLPGAVLALRGQRKSVPEDN